MSQEATILQKSKELFFRLGVKSITMDDLAREMGISKKTIYLYVANKSELVDKVLRMHVEDEKATMCQIIEESSDAIHQIRLIIKAVLSQLRNIHPSSIYDIQKYYPKTWQIFLQFKNDFIYTCVKENLERGIKEGLYRENLNADLVARLYINSIEFIVNPAFFPATQYNFSDLYIHYINYHIRGVVSEKGAEYLKTIELSEINE
jgi:AcrR family transcriptional regulator